MGAGTEQATRPRLGERLVERGQLGREELGVALREQRRFHRPLGEILVSLGFVRQEEVARLVAEDLGLEFLRAADVEPDPLVVSGLDPSFVRETLAFPWALRDGTIHVLMVDPDDPRRAAAVRERFPYPLAVAITTEEDVLDLVRTHLQSHTSRVAELLGGVDVDDGGAAGVPVEELTNALLLDGVHRGATDVHLEPGDLVTRVRYRVDGILQGGENLPKALTPSVVSRIKVMAHLDISERRRPQDGRLRVELDDREVDMRVSVLPCIHGENVVLRVLDGGGAVLRLQNLGVSNEHQRLLARVVFRPHGLFLVTGPTGSGKTTTLYAMLSIVDAMHRKVATIEDPIEYRLPLLRQTQVDPTIGFTFDVGLRSLLRQDPDVVLLGEIRDRETADMAVKAAMTGHLVLATLHTNSAVGAVPRLIDMGVEPFLVEDSLIGAMSQRLVRRTCTHCRTERPATEEERRWLGDEDARVWQGEGCARCDGTGFVGRTALVELFLPDAEAALAIREGAGADRMEELAHRAGFASLAEDGRRLVRAGVSTVEEVLRMARGVHLESDER